MPGRSMAGRESLKLAMSVRLAPRQPDCCELKVRGVVKATVTSLSKKTPYLTVPSSRSNRVPGKPDVGLLG